MKKTILFVDDEGAILRSLKRLFINTEYRCFFVLSAAQALEVLEKEPVSMVISDMRMPDQDGYDFLSEVKKTYPSVLRVVLSGFSEKQDLLKCVIDGIAMAYIVKPWDGEKIVHQIRHWFTLKDQIHNKRVTDKLSIVSQMPVLPEIYQKISKAVETDVDMKIIADLIEQEPGTSAKILAIVNSAFFGSSIGSVKQALMYLGLVNIRDIILFSNVFSVFRSRGRGELSPEKIAGHARLTNALFHVFYYMVYKKQVPEEFASVGLLHDIGMVLLLRYYPDDYEKVLNYCTAFPDVTLEDAEMKFLNVTHSEVGGYLLDWWNLPFYYAETALYHHNPDSEHVQHRDIIELIHLADYFSRQETGFFPIKSPPLFYQENFSYKISDFSEKASEVFRQMSTDKRVL